MRASACSPLPCGCLRAPRLHSSTKRRQRRRQFRAHMTNILLRIVGTLLVLHGAATFVAAKFLPLSAIGDRLLFAQHGFTFIFLAVLNLVIWPSALHGAFFRWTLHISNLAFFLFYVAISLRMPEPPNF